MFLLFVIVCHSNIVAATTTVDVSPPPESCRTTWTSDSVCNPLEAAVNAASGVTVINLASGSYFNEGFNSSKLDNPVVVTIKDKDDITIQAAPYTGVGSELNDRSYLWLQL